MRRQPNWLTCLAASICMQGVFATGNSYAQLVFDNGGPNVLNTSTGDPLVDPPVPPVNILVQDRIDGFATSLQVEDGAVIGGGSGQSVGLFGQSVFVMTGGSASGDLSVTDTAQATISGGTFGDDLFVSGFGEVTLSTETFDDVTVTQNGKVNILPGARIVDDAFFRNNSRLEMSGGVLPDEVEIRDSATALFTGGVIGDDLVVDEMGQVEIQFLEIVDTLEAEGNSTTNVFNGIFGGVEAIENATVNIFDGTFGEVLAANSAALMIAGGTFSEGVAATQGANVVVQAATFAAFDGSELRAVLNGTLDVMSATATELDVEAGNGGSVNLRDFEADNATISMIGGGVANVLGGSADSLQVRAEVGSILNLRGGDFDQIRVDLLSESVMNVLGHSFTFNGIPVEDLNAVLGDGAFVPETGELRTVAGDIAGVLADGSAFQLTYARSFLNPPARVFLQQVPEPNSTVLTLLLLATAGLAGIKKQFAQV